MPNHKTSAIGEITKNKTHSGQLYKKHIYSIIRVPFRFWVSGPKFYVGAMNALNPKRKELAVSISDFILLKLSGKSPLGGKAGLPT